MAALATRPPEEIHVILEAVGSEIWLHWQKIHTQKRKENLVREKANGVCHVLSWKKLAATFPVSKSKTG